MIRRRRTEEEEGKEEDEEEDEEEGEKEDLNVIIVTVFVRLCPFKSVFDEDGEKED